MSQTLTFNKIHIIESLHSNDRKTGSNLYNDVIKFQTFKNDILKADLHRPKNRTDFFAILASIKKEVIEEDIHPVIHIEMHGNEKGVETTSKDFIKWQELNEDLAAINMHSNFNFFLTLGICKGAHLMKVIRPNQPAPFWGFVSPNDDVKAINIEKSYNVFYKEFFDSLNFTSAVKKLNKANPNDQSTYDFINAEKTFTNVFDHFFQNQGSNSGLIKDPKSFLS